MRDATSVATPVFKKPRSRSFLVDLLIRLVHEKPMGTFGGAIVLILLLAGLFANTIAPYGMNDQDLTATLKPPSAEHLLGTDNLGRDLFSRIVYGARISMTVGLAGSTLAVVIGIVIGLSVFFGEKVDIATQRFVDAWLTWPSLFIFLTVMAVLGSGITQVILVLGGVSGIHASRIVRSAVISVKESVYIQAAPPSVAQRGGYWPSTFCQTSRRPSSSSLPFRWAQ